MRNIVATRDVGNTAIGDAIGFYSDVRNAGVRGQFDNLRIQGEDFLVAGETLLVDGDVTLSADTTLALDVFNPLIGDRLEVGGHLTAAGTIEVLLDAAAATPTLGDVFDVLDFASASGAFNAYQLPSLDAGLAWSVTDLLVTGELSVVTDVDLDNDGLVTGSDFLAIQRSNPALIAEWQRQLGNQLVAPTPARAQPVPEPTAAVICSLLASAVVALRQFIATR